MKKPDAPGWYVIEHLAKVSEYRTEPQIEVVFVAKIGTGMAAIFSDGTRVPLSSLKITELGGASASVDIAMDSVRNDFATMLKEKRRRDYALINE